MRNCVLLSTEEGDVVLDPFAGIGTTLTIAQEMNRIGIGFEIDKNYIDIYSQSI